jgi:glycosyltransferase involved in cell wall biosynthesis
MQMSSGISVIIPAYNREHLIKETLKSLLGQSVPAEEIIVVDDGSSDTTPEVAEAFGSPVRVIRQANAGPAAARNRGLAEARGEYIHFFDSDDIALSNKHEVQLSALECSGADIAYGPWIKGCFGKGTFTPENQVYQQRGLPKGNLVEALLSSWSVVPHTCLFRRSIVEQSGGFPESLKIGEDQLFFLKCLLGGAQVVHSPETLVLYRVENSDKLTASSSGEALRRIDWARFLLKAYEHCKESGVDASKWVGFQYRFWSAMRDVASHSFEEKPALAEAAKVIIRRPQWMYRWQGYIGRKADSLRARSFGRRGGSSFAMGRLSGQQLGLMASAGYRSNGSSAKL